eukprot:350177-Chlamydomonas_euryale.AAC.2
MVRVVGAVRVAPDECVVHCRHTVWAWGQVMRIPAMPFRGPGCNARRSRRMQANACGRTHAGGRMLVDACGWTHAGGVHTAERMQRTQAGRHMRVDACVWTHAGGAHTAACMQRTQAGRHMRVDACGWTQTGWSHANGCMPALWPRRLPHWPPNHHTMPANRHTSLQTDRPTTLPPT